MKRTPFKGITHREAVCFPLLLLVIIAYCTPAGASPTDRISNKSLRSYTERDLERGAPFLKTTSRVLLHEAHELLNRGDWRQAREKLILSAELSGDYPDPLFTLARIELLHAHPDFLFHLVGAIKRTACNFRSQVLLAANVTFVLIVSALGGLLITLIALLARYWPFLEHRIRESYSKRYLFPPESWIFPLILLSLLILRLGIALYVTILIVALWSFINREERVVILSLVIAISALSFGAGCFNSCITALDPGSVTHRLSLINERGADARLTSAIESIDVQEFRDERDFALGTLMYRIGNYEEAKIHLLRSVSKRDNYAPAFLTLGNVYFNEGDFDKALAGYQNAIRLDSTYALAYHNIGQTCIKKMLFAESSSALKKANELGIEKYRMDHISAGIIGRTVYEDGFSASDLWNIALHEGKARETHIISNILQPYLLFPFHRLGILLVTCMIAVLIAGKMIPERWRVFQCDNCRRPTCQECADTEMGISICKKCSHVIDGLTSIKVMEALLRHRRQRISGQRMGGKGWILRVLPGLPFIYYGKSAAGAFLASASIAALSTLIWGGFFFKDPTVIIVFDPLWKIVAPLVMITLGYALSIRAKAPPEQKNYRILPMDLRTENEEERPAEKPPERIVKEPDPVETFLDSL